MTTYRDTLKRAAALLESSPIAWTKNEFAHDLAGNPVKPKAPQACSWCALGAIRKVAFNTAEAYAAVLKLHATVREPIGKWNDTQTDKSVVIAKLREAAK